MKRPHPSCSKCGGSGLWFGEDCSCVLDAPPRGEDPFRKMKCVTHHLGCDCREERMRRLEAVAEAARILDQPFITSGTVDCAQRRIKLALAALDSAREGKT